MAMCGITNPSEKVFTFDLSPGKSQDAFLLDHKIDGCQLFPPSGYLVLAWKTLAEMMSLQEFGQLPVVIQDVEMKRPVLLKQDGTITLHVHLILATGEFRVIHINKLVASGVISPAKGAFLDQEAFPAVFKEQDKLDPVKYEVNQQDVYKELKIRGFDYGPGFQAIAGSDTTGFHTRLAWSGKWMSLLEGILQTYSLTFEGLAVLQSIRSVKIDPSKMLNTNNSIERIETPCHYDSAIDMVFTNAVEMRGILTIPTISNSSRSDVTPFIQSLRFLPSHGDLPEAVTVFLDPACRVKPCEHAYISETRVGDLASLTWLESELQHDMSEDRMDGKEMMYVYYSALNLKDVMIATGKIPSDVIEGVTDQSELRLGMECTGRDAKGRRRMCFVHSKGFATTALVDPRTSWEIPENWSMEEAASVPIAYSTAYIALIERAQIRSGEKILIHSGCGGLGQAVIRIALSRNCEVFTTVSSQEKRDFLKRTFPQINDENIAYSRDLSFELHVLRRTQGRGVDVVLNALAGGKLRAGLRLLADNGRFVELGKRDVESNSPIGMSFLRTVTSLHSFHMDHAVLCREKWPKIHKLVQEGIDTGVVQPLRVTVFEKDQMCDAFKYMIKGEHIGKVVVKIRDEETDKKAMPSVLSVPALTRIICHPRKIYVVAGGLDIFGVDLADWLVQRGAKRVVLLGRTVSGGYLKRREFLWRGQDVALEVFDRDLSTVDGARGALQEAAKWGPIAGVFDLSMFDSLTELDERPDQCVADLIARLGNITANLDAVTRDLSKKGSEKGKALFVVLSCMVGAEMVCPCEKKCPILSSHGSERICERRKADGHHALAIRYGPISGHPAAYGLHRNSQSEACRAQSISSCLEVLDHFLSQDQHTILTCCVPT